MTLLDAWNDSIPGCPGTNQPWGRPCQRGILVVEVGGFRLAPHRFAYDGKTFRLDTFLLDGRTLRLFLPPGFPCERVRDPIGAPPYRVAEALGFPPRDHSKCVTDADRLVLDLTETPKETHGTT